MKSSSITTGHPCDPGGDGHALPHGARPPARADTRADRAARADSWAAARADTQAARAARAVEASKRHRTRFLVQPLFRNVESKVHMDTQVLSCMVPPV